MRKGILTAYTEPAIFIMPHSPRNTGG